MLLPLGLPRQAKADKTFDLVIKGGRIVDGSGAPGSVGDVGIDAGLIVRIGSIDESEAEQVIDAGGLVVAPGFVHMMGQTASPMIEDPETAINLLTRGITTINAGEGESAAPLSEPAGKRQGYTTMSEYFALLESKGLPVNVVQTVGHTQVRRIVLGEVDRRPSDAELDQMKALVDEAMRAGAIGVSTALTYPPAVHPPTREIAALAAAAGRYGGRYYTHIGSEGDRLLQAIDEALEIGRRGNTPVHIFHLKAAGQQNGGKVQQAIARIKAARAAGQQVTADIYPYVNNGLGIAALIHPRGFGSFPRLLSRYVRDLGVISLERAVAQASAAAANNVMAYDRGRIAVGLAADVIVFDDQNLTDHADFKDPQAVCEGVKHVVVNGVTVLRDAEFTGKRPGRVLRGPGFDERKAAYNVSAGNKDTRFAGYDRAMRAFLRKHRVPGVSIAVTHRGRVVFARGYGYADIAGQQPVHPESLFRIASISKPITAGAVLQLIEKGKLKLEDKILELLDHEADIEAAADAFDPRYRDVTVRHLLEHRGGWDRDKSFDAMFQSVRFAEQTGTKPPAGPAAVIKAMFSQSLDFDPGERYAYSNFGYCLLGRLIETVSGQPYEGYVKEHVLAPLGITSMRIGATRLDGRAEKEVRYYQPGTSKSVFEDDLNETVPPPYGGWYLEAMDAHGGWIASASDLAKFASAFDDPDRCPVLSRESIETMHARPPGKAGFDEDGKPKDRYYSLGWSNRRVGEGKFNRWHTGSLPGTATILIRRHDGKNFVALMNARVSPTASHLGREMDRLLHRMADEVSAWPE